MTLLNIFKKKSTQGGKPIKVHEVKPLTTPKAEQPKPKKISGQAYRVLKKIRIAEKATDLLSQNQYVFEVFPDSNKNQIKGAVEDVYGVDVLSVNIVNIPRKKRRLGRISGWQAGAKKAVVRIKEGQKIEVLPR